MPFKALLPMVDPADLVIGGWDISSATLAEGMERAQVFDYELQRQLAPYMKDMVPLPGIYDPKFIAANQAERADHTLAGSKAAQVEAVRGHMRDFKAQHGLDKLVVLWTGNTERYADVRAGLNDSAGALGPPWRRRARTPLMRRDGVRERRRRVQTASWRR